MSTIEAMQAYIAKSNLKEVRHYEMVLQEIQSLRNLAIRGKIWDALEIAFYYGRAKGYRMAKKELRHG